ncbi:M48 family metallopeptidase [Chlorobium sp. BLA1]|uniref:M48 family metallopeptidase n=1 Tax=Candidatus Chlorobium masyuteum TaxID=2716876 RepID=UPI001420EBB6|nr:M48 family metallopeptidase [Candidatus Chlorobium masyuteum]NHQ60236.1 M48 family metallopeptidase [Candidatus Chlorobium masyuteum]NTU44504.1 M48 family metallopeptidase [Chlorobiaceae bacterium]
MQTKPETSLACAFKHKGSWALLLLLHCMLLSSCVTVPITGRSQLNIVSSSGMLALSNETYGKFKKSNQESADRKNTALVKNVGTRLQLAVEHYLRSNGMAAEVNGYLWEFKLFESKDVNAFALPGGKVVIYTGILPFTKTDAGLAVVMSHEIAHVIARHGNERMSQALISQMGGIALNEALSSQSQKTKDLWAGIYGIGTTFGFLMPYSRMQETEADHIGLIFMAMAGYDPNEAVPFWRRMAAQPGNRPLEFLSTHPAPESRIRQIQSEIPEAMRYYRK